MADSPYPQEETLVEEREDQLVSPCGGKPSLRIAHFLKPSLPPSSKQPSRQTLFNPTKKPIISNLKSLYSKVQFRSWRFSQKKWNSWVEKMRSSFQTTWKKASIYEPIMASTLEIPRCTNTIFSLSQKWCSETNSFVLPWGEITITLEDIMILGGYSITGDSVLRGLHSKELYEIEDKLLEARSKICKTSSKRACQYQWRDMWMNSGSKFEHEAFLAYWLSGYVFPADSHKIINKSVFSIAILLARGTKIALAPAILANMYRDLRLLKEKIETLGDQDDENVPKLGLLAPFQLLQVWVWERFPTLSPKPSPMILDGLPRIARWQKVKILKINGVGLAVDGARSSYRWRPYCTTLNNWSFCCKLYSEKERWVSLKSNVDLDLQSYVRCIRVSELVGLDCVEQYLPNRVSMQFGLDQDIPSVFPRLKDGSLDIAWRDYDRPIRDTMLYMPSRLFESDVTTRYLEWWKKSILVKEERKLNANMCDGKPKRSVELSEKLRIKFENNEADVPPGFDPKRKRVLEDESSHQSCSKMSKRSKGGGGNRTEVNGGDASSNSSPQMKGIEEEEEGDSDSDNLTLTQLFQRKRSNTTNRNGSSLLSHSKSPSSSAGENVTIQETRSVTKCTVEDGIESNSGSPIKSPMNTNKNDVGAILNDTSESSELDLMGRISRLRRIVDWVIAMKIGQP